MGILAQVHPGAVEGLAELYENDPGELHALTVVLSVPEGAASCVRLSARMLRGLAPRAEQREALANELGDVVRERAPDEDVAARAESILEAAAAGRGRAEILEVAPPVAAAEAARLVLEAVLERFHKGLGYCVSAGEALREIGHADPALFTR